MTSPDDHAGSGFSLSGKARQRSTRISLATGLITLLIASSLQMGCSSIGCNLQLKDGNLVWDLCGMAQDQQPQRGTDEKPATNDPEKPSG